MAKSSDIKAGRAAVEVGLDDSKLMAGMKSLGGKLKSAGAALGTVGLSIFAGGAAAVGLFAPTIKAASDMEETMNKFNVVFGDSSDRVKGWSDGLASEVGRSKKQIAEFMASSQDLFVPLGFDSGSAEDMSKQVTKLAIDLASFNNIADADAMNDLQAALTGSGEVMKKYGVIVSEAAVKQKLLEQGINPNKATEQEKVMARLNIIMAGTTAAQGDAIRSAGGFANQMKRLEANVDDAKVAIGEALLPAVTSLVNKAGDWVRVASTWIANNKPLVMLLAKIAVGVALAGVAIAILGGALIGLGSLLSSLTVIIPAVGMAFGALLSPFGLVVASVVAITASLARLYKAGYLDGLLERFRELGQIPFVAEILQQLKNLGGYLGGEFFGLLQDLGKTFKETFDGVRAAISTGDWKAAGEIAMAGLEAAWAAGVYRLIKVFGDFGVAVVEVFVGIMSSISNMWQDAIAGIEKGLLSLAKKDGIVGDAMAKVLGVDLREEQKRSDMLNDSLGQKRTDVFADAGRALDDANKDAREQSDAKWSAILKRVEDYRDQQVNSALDASGQANSTLTGLVGKAKQKAADMAVTAPGTTPGAAPGPPPDTKKALQEFSSAGTFSGFRLGAQFGGLEQITKDQLTEQRKANRVLTKIEKNLHKPVYM